MKTYDKIYNLVKKIPKGKVSTYGQIGQMLNLNPRVVGWALNRLAKRRVMSLRGGTKCRRSNLKNVREIASVVSLPRNDRDVPWHRVINSKGGISTNKLMNIPLGLQKKLLEREKIKFGKDGNLDFRRYLWRKN